MLIRILKRAGGVVAYLAFLAVIGAYCLFFGDFDPPYHEPPCKAGSIVALLDPCEVTP